MARQRTDFKGGRRMATKRKGSPLKRKSRPPAKLHQPADLGQVRIYTLAVFLISGQITERFAKKNPVVSRTIQIRGDQTLQDLHHAIFDAFDRWDDHLYEFLFGKGPMDPKGPRYVLPASFEIDSDMGKRPAGRVDETTIESLGMEVGRSFGYWFDFGDDWRHQIDVVAIDDTLPKGKFPKVTKRVGKSPPQYIEE
jgi:Plasmid pRiA4b ORF-3-like protein